MNSLAFDCTGAFCSASIVDEDDRVLASRSEKKSRGQAEALMPMIEGVLRDSGVRWGDVGLVCVTVGPGTFTGLRVGLAVARGIALATSVPVVGVTVMDVVAHATTGKERAGRTLLAIADGKRADLFIQGFDENLQPLGNAKAMMPSAINGVFPGPLLLAGDGAARALAEVEQAVLSDVMGVNSTHLALLARRRWREGRSEALHPLYLAPADVSVPGGMR